MHKDIYPLVSYEGGVNKTAAFEGNNIIDMQGYEEALILIASETITDGGYTFELKEGDNSALSDAAAVADGDLISGGTTSGDKEPVFAATDDDQVRWFWYKGNKRYLRIDLKTVTGTPGTGGMFCGIVVRMKARHQPAV